MCICECTRLPRQLPCCRCQLSAASLPLGTDWKGDEGCFLPSASAHSQAAGSRQPRTNIDTTHSASMAATDVDVFSVSHWPRRSLLFTPSFSYLFSTLRRLEALFRESVCQAQSSVLFSLATTPPLFSACFLSLSVCVCIYARARHDMVETVPYEGRTGFSSSAEWMGGCCKCVWVCVCDRACVCIRVRVRVF